MKISGTGHRPDQLKGGYQNYPKNLLPLVEVLKNVLSLYPVTEVNTGMAQGFDTALAAAAIQLGIRLNCEIPFPGFESKWGTIGQKHYYTILDKAYHVNYVFEDSPDTKNQAVGMLMQRNRVLCDNCDVLVAFWNGNDGGGTYNAINYFQMKYPHKNIINIYDLYQVKVRFD